MQICLFLVSIPVLAQCSGQLSQQKFRTKPHDMTVLEGSEAVLRCEVQNVGGQVQWTKDGFALGEFTLNTASNELPLIISSILRILNGHPGLSEVFSTGRPQPRRVQPEDIQRVHRRRRRVSVPSRTGQTAFGNQGQCQAHSNR